MCFNVKGMNIIGISLCFLGSISPMVASEPRMACNSRRTST